MAKILLLNRGGVALSGRRSVACPWGEPECGKEFVAPPDSISCQRPDRSFLLKVELARVCPLNFGK